MPNLLTAPAAEIERLLKLFPADILRTVWGTDTLKTKDAIAASIARQAAIRQQVAAFVDAHFSCCKQHVYILAVGDQPTRLANQIGELELLDRTAGRALYLTRVQRHVIIDGNPPQHESISFLLPVVIESIEGHLVVRFVTLEKKLSAYFPGQTIFNGPAGIDERDLVATVMASLELGIADLNAGVKELWHTGFMDAFSVRFKRPQSTAFEVMDEERGIREHNDHLYQQLRTLPLGNTLFRMDPQQGLGVETFSVDPSKGTIGFGRYSETAGETDRVIREILQRNQ